MRLFVRAATASYFFLAAGISTTSSFSSNNNSSRASSRFMTSNNMVTSSFQHPSIDFVHLESVDSTQEEVKRRLKKASEEDSNNNNNKSKKKMLAISAQEQSMGRGTSGRKWIGLGGNMFLTMGIPMDRVQISPPTLLPLQMGILVAQRIEKLVQACSNAFVATTNSATSDGTTKIFNNNNVPKVHVKWPNDVLLNGGKVAGILIESTTIVTTAATSQSWFLIGIGINIMESPIVPQEGPNRGRPAISIRSLCAPESPPPMETNQILAQDLAISLHDWLEQAPSTTTTTKRTLLNEWKDLADWSTPMKVRETGEDVLPLDIQSDGSLIVRGENGIERTLVADYLY